MAAWYTCENISGESLLLIVEATLAARELSGYGYGCPGGSNLPGAVYGGEYAIYAAVTATYNHVKSSK